MSHLGDVESAPARDGPRVVPDGGDGRTDRSDGEFPRPPFSFADDEGREVDIRVFDGDIDALVEMYERLDPADGAQGIPPRKPDRLRSWVEMLTETGLTLLAWHDGAAVGHAVLVPMDDRRWELAIFVRSDYQHAHVGTALLGCLLGYGRDEGVETVWLSVEHHNEPALGLYESLGFERLSGQVEYRMERDL